MTEELKPCPFCGKEAKVVYKDVEPQGDPWYGSNYQRFVQCNGCGCSMFDSYFHDGFINDENAAKAWNTRPVEDELRQRVAELEAENFKLSAGLCIHPKGITGDDYGNATCPLAGLEEKNKKLRRILSYIDSRTVIKAKESAGYGTVIKLMDI